MKLKRSGETMNINLVPNPDIAAALGQIKKDAQTLVGFALETNDEESNALGKMERKNLDFIVLNSLQDKGAGFRVDTNKITILNRNGDKKEFALKLKSEVASDIIDELVKVSDNK